MVQKKLDISFDYSYPVKPAEKRSGGCDVCGGWLITYDRGTHPNPKFRDILTFVCEWCNSTFDDCNNLMDKRFPPEMIDEYAKELIKTHARG